MNTLNRFVALGMLLAAGAAQAFVVNDIGDASDANPGDGFCDIPVGGPPRCTLRAAIEEANAFGGGHLIEFSVGLFTITPATPLPTISSVVTIDATTAPGYNTGASSVLDATPLVRLDGSSLGGTTADGLRVASTAAVTIRGLAIFNFPDNGIEIVNSSTVELDSNWIGVRHDGAAGGNGGSGVYISNCDRCVVGTDVVTSPTIGISGRGNLISNNAEDGIYVQLGADGQIAGNYIGTNPAGGSAFGNSRHGIQLVGPDNFLGIIAGTASGPITSPNYIEYNAGDGIRTTTGTQRIHVNEIFANGGNGISLNGGSSEVGDSVAGRRNLIAANAGHGIHVGNLATSSGNVIEENWIYQNQQRGVQVSAGSNNSVVFNQIFDNDNDAVYLADEDNTVQDNDIGFLNGSLVGNGANGIVVAAGGNLLQGNRIGGMADDGIDVVSGVTSTITGNSVGAQQDGSLFGNTGVGIRVRAAAVNTQILDNVIGDNSDGVLLEGATNDVCGNLIGLGSSNENIGNAIEGIRVLGGANVIGDEGAGCTGNHIGFNASDGIQVHGDNNTIRNNTIGGQRFVDLGNGRGGVLLTDGASLNDVSDNVIWNNDDGIRVGSTAGTGNRLEDNNFGGHADLAIDLNDDGDTPNDAGDVDSGPNNLQNYPVISQVDDVGGQLSVTYFVDSGTGQSAYPLQVDFYYNSQDFREGYRIHVDSYNVAPGSNRTITIDPPFDNGYLMAMVIDADGNSSEIGVQQAFTITPPPDELFKDRFEMP